jgi:hypothetical protein
MGRRPDGSGRPFLVGAGNAFIFVCMSLARLGHWPRVGLAQYGTVIVQWYVMHSHERRLPGSMIDGELEVCFEVLLSVVLAKRRM